MSVRWACLNGEWVPDSELAIDVNDAGFLLGATVTERLRTFNGRVFRLEEHLNRLRRSLDIAGLPTESIASQIASAIPEFADRNRTLLDPADDWSILAFATPGIAGAGRPTVCVHGYPLPFSRWASHFEEGVRVAISDVRQMPPETLPPELKCRSRMHLYIADQRAAIAHPGARAILLDGDGYVAEATTANVLIYREGEGLVTPPPEHILFGVSLGVVEELAAKCGLPFRKRSLTVDQLRCANEAMMTSTSICLQPIVECDGKPIADCRPGPIYRKLLAAWNDLVGLDIPAQARQFATR